MMTETKSIIETAKSMAAEYHKGMTDRYENPYADHLERVADRVRETGQPITLEPMSPSERRIIHMALSENSRVITESNGTGDERKITISPSEN